MAPPGTSTKSVTLTAGANLSDTRCYLKGSQGELYEATLDLSDKFIDSSTRDDFATRLVEYAPLGFVLDCDEQSSLCSVTWNSTSRSIFYQDKSSILREWRLVDGKGWQKTTFEQPNVMLGTNVTSVPGIYANGPPLLFYQDRTGFVCYRTMPTSNTEDGSYTIDATQITRGSPLTGIGACVEADQKTIRIYYQDGTLAVRESYKGRYGGWIQTRELVAKRDMVINDIVTFTPVLNGSREIRLYMQDAKGTVIECKRSRAAWECVSLTTKAMTSANIVAACWLSPKPRIGVLWISGDRHLYICDNDGSAEWREPLPLILLELKRPKDLAEGNSMTPFDRPVTPTPSTGNGSAQPSSGHGAPSLQPPPPLNKKPSRRGWGAWGGWGSSSEETRSGPEQSTGAKPASDTAGGPAAAAPQGDPSLRKPSPAPERPAETTKPTPGSTGSEAQRPARQQPPTTQPLAPQPLAPQPAAPQPATSPPPSAQLQTSDPSSGQQPSSPPKNGVHGPEKGVPPAGNEHQGKQGSTPPKPIYGGAGGEPIVQEPDEEGTKEHGSERPGPADEDEDDDTPVARHPTKHKPTQQPSTKPKSGAPAPAHQQHEPKEDDNDDDIPTLRKPAKHAPGTPGTATPKPSAPALEPQQPSQGAPATNGGRRKQPQRKPTIAVPTVVSPTDTSGPAGGELLPARAIARVCVAVNVRVNGIRLVYTDGSETAWRGTNSGVEHEFALTPGEHITHVWYATDRRCIEGVLFGTSRGRKSMWYGQEYGLYGLMVNEGHVVDDLLGGSQEGQLNTLMSEWAPYLPSGDIAQYRKRYAELSVQCTQFQATVADWERQIASSRDGLDHLDTAAVAAKLERVVGEVKLRRQLERGKGDSDSELDPVVSRERLLSITLGFVRTAASDAEAAFKTLADVLAPVSGNLDSSSASKRSEGIALRVQLVRLSEELQLYLQETSKSVSILREEEQLWAEEVKLADASLTQDRRVFDKNLAAKKVKSMAPDDKDAPLWGLQEWSKQLGPGALETAFEKHVVSRLVKSAAQWQYDTSHVEFLQQSQQQRSAGKTEAEGIRVQITEAIATLDRVIASIDALQPNGSAIFQGAQELVALVDSCIRGLEQFQHIDDAQKLAAILVSMLNSLVDNANFKWGQVDPGALLKVSSKDAASEN